ncbi:hypothetical protein ACFU5Y_11810 [Streptomyces gardneri]|uniref:hypothetical protein n=1 Tax=Streptomyces gardneri TaxID=66892 RepID=UPI003680E216
MLEQALTAVAAAGGLAVVQAAGTDAWTGVRQAVARWFGRGDGERERVELERLDRTAEALAAAEGDTAVSLRVRQEAAWQTRIEAVLEQLDDTERRDAADELWALLDRYRTPGGASADHKGVAISGDVTARATRGGIAMGVVNGEVRIGPPPTPDPSQG